MRKLFFLILVFPSLLKGQEASIHFDIKNSRVKRIAIVKDNYTKAARLFKDESEIIVPLKNGKAVWTCKLESPIPVITYYEDTITKKNYVYQFFLSPGDNLFFSFDSKKTFLSFSVKGKGSQNNQPLIQNLVNGKLELDVYRKDSLPGNVFKAIFKRANFNQKTLREYIAKNRPTKDFEKFHSLYAKYFIVWAYLQFKNGQKFSARQPYLRNEATWEAIEDSLIKTISLNNNDVLYIDEFNFFLSNYLSQLLKKGLQSPEFSNGSSGTGIKAEKNLRNEETENLLKEKIIEKNFSGKTAEFLYGVLFRSAINENEDSLPEIFLRFKAKYPQSPYIPFIEPAILKMEERSLRKLTDEMIIIDSNFAYNKFDDLLKLVEGKTVLVDMWGTWCGPCRSEISINLDSIKDYFKGKALTYLYIANYDLGNKRKWKELISYYGLKGINILASEELTVDIMANVESDGFPTYIIIKKDGSFELSQAGYPMDREILYKQIERILRE